MGLEDLPHTLRYLRLVVFTPLQYALCSPCEDTSLTKRGVGKKVVRHMVMRDLSHHELTFTTEYQLRLSRYARRIGLPSRAKGGQRWQQPRAPRTIHPCGNEELLDRSGAGMLASLQTQKF